MRILRHFRYFSPAEMVEIANRLNAVADRDKIARLQPPTAALAARAIWRLAAEPTREQVMAVICGRTECPTRETCMGCLSKANTINQLYDRTPW